MRWWLRELFRLIAGTPQRFLWSCAVAGLIFVSLRPGLLWEACRRLDTELSPLLADILAILIVVGGLRLILFGRRK